MKDTRQRLDSAPLRRNGSEMRRVVVFVPVAFVPLALFVAATSDQRVESSLYESMLGALLSHSVPEISVQQARETDSCVWLDAREPAEFEVSHIEGARHVGYKAFDTNSVAAIERTACVIVYCSVGYRSEKVGEKLHAGGFLDVRNLYGGIFEWVNRGFPLVDSSGEVTDKVHAYGRVWGVWLERGERVY